MKTAMVLVSYCRSEPGFSVLRVYMEKDFKQAERDRDMLDLLAQDKVIELKEVEIYGTWES